MRTQLGCTACDDGNFVSDQVCEACQGTVEHCNALYGRRRLEVLGVSPLAQTNERRDGVRGTRRLVGRPARRPVLIIGVAALIVLTAVNGPMKAQKQQERTTCVFAMERSNVSFVPLGDGLVASTRLLVLDGFRRGGDK